MEKGHILGMDKQSLGVLGEDLGTQIMQSSPLTTGRNHGFDKAVRQQRPANCVLCAAYGSPVQERLTRVTKSCLDKHRTDGQTP